MSEGLLRGQRVLLVEDNGAQARQFSNLLKKAGAVVVGPAKTVAAAERLVANGNFAVAWLDVCLDEGGGEGARVWPVARLLDSLGVPFLFCTSAPGEAELAKWPGRPIVSKPLRTHKAQQDILALLVELIAGTARTAAKV